MCDGVNTSIQYQAVSLFSIYNGDLAFAFPLPPFPYPDQTCENGYLEQSIQSKQNHANKNE